MPPVPQPRSSHTQFAEASDAARDVEAMDPAFAAALAEGIFAHARFAGLLDSNGLLDSKDSAAPDAPPEANDFPPLDAKAVAEAEAEARGAALDTLNQAIEAAPLVEDENVEAALKWCKDRLSVMEDQAQEGILLDDLDQAIASIEAAPDAKNFEADLKCCKERLSVMEAHGAALKCCKERLSFVEAKVAELFAEIAEDQAADVTLFHAHADYWNAEARAMFDANPSISIRMVRIDRLATWVWMNGTLALCCDTCASADDKYDLTLHCGNVVRLRSRNVTFLATYEPPGILEQSESSE